MARKVDGNQPEIVQALRQCGASVQCLHTLGHGCPDILIGWHGRNILVEIKSGDRGTLTVDERAWHIAWRGQVAIIRSIDDALALLGVSDVG